MEKDIYMYIEFVSSSFDSYFALQYLVELSNLAGPGSAVLTLLTVI